MVGLARGIAALLLSMMLGACTLSAPNDLLFEDVEAVQFFKGPGVWVLEDVGDARKEAIWLVRVRFSSKHDLLKFSRLESLHLTYEAALCNDRNFTRKKIFVFPAWKIGTYTDGDFSRPQLSDLEQFREPNGRLIYHAFIPIVGDNETQVGLNPRVSQRNYLSYTAFSENLCLEVRGKHMLPGETSLSNTVQVPAAQLTRVLDLARLRSRGN